MIWMHKSFDETQSVQCIWSFLLLQLQTNVWFLLESDGTIINTKSASSLYSEVSFLLSSADMRVALSSLSAIPLHSLLLQHLFDFIPLWTSAVLRLMNALSLLVVLCMKSMCVLVVWSENKAILHPDSPGLVSNSISSERSRFYYNEFPWWQF